MPRSPEFDFSKLEDQQKFEELPKKKREKFIEGQMDEGYAMNNLMIAGVASNPENAEEILEEYKKSPDFSFSQFSGSLEEIKNIKEQGDSLENERSDVKNKVEHWKKEFIGLKDQLGREIAENIAQKVLGDDYRKIKNDIISCEEEIAKLRRKIDEYVKASQEEATRKGKGWGRSDYKDTLDPLDNKVEDFYKKIVQARKELRKMISANFSDDNDRLMVATHIEGEPLSYGAVCSCGCTGGDPEPYLSAMKELNLEKFVSSHDENNQYRYEKYWEKFRDIKRLQSRGTGYSNVYAVKPEVIDGIAEDFIVKHKDLLNAEDVDRFSTLQKSTKNFNKRLQETADRKKDLAIKLDGYSILMRNGISIKKVEELMPWAIESIANRGDKIVKADLRNKIIALLSGNHHHYYGSGGSEYGVKAMIIRGNPVNKIEKYYKWRDAYDPNKDDRRYCFTDLEIIDVGEDSVKIKLINSDPDNKFEKIEIFEIKKRDEEMGKKDILLKEEQEKWLEKYNEAKRIIIEENYLRNAKMPSYIEYTFAKGQVPYDATMNQKEISYDQPEFIDEHFDESVGLGVVIIKTQIDHAVGRGKQFSWRGYIIDKDGNKKRVWDRNLWEIHLKQGEGIEMKAADLLKLAERK